MSELYCGNAWEWIASQPDKSVDVIITDPMYSDIMDMPALRRICKGHIIMFCDPRFRFFVPDEVALWMKPPSSKNTSRHLAHPFEEIIIERHGNVYNYDVYESANFNGVYYDILLEKRIHPFQKPISLIERLVAIYSMPGEIIFDPFFGSGAILKAAANLGRRTAGCESDLEYFEQYKEQVTA